jgi:hypothetical protein
MRDEDARHPAFPASAAQNTNLVASDGTASAVALQVVKELADNCRGQVLHGHAIDDAASLAAYKWQQQPSLGFAAIAGTPDIKRMAVPLLLILRMEGGAGITLSSGTRLFRFWVKSQTPARKSHNSLARPRVRQDADNLVIGAGVADCADSIQRRAQKQLVRRLLVEPRYLCVSYASHLTERDNDRCLNVIRSDQYQKYWAKRFQLLTHSAG